MKNRAGLGLQLTQTAEIDFGIRRLRTEFQQRCVSQNSCSGGGILFTRQLQHQLIGPDGLQSRLRDTEAIDTPIQHRLHGFKFLVAD